MVRLRTLALSMGLLALALFAAAFAPPAAAASSCDKLTASMAFAPMVDTDGDGRYDGIHVSIRVTLIAPATNASGSLIVNLERPIGTSVESQGTPDFSINDTEDYQWDPTMHIDEDAPEGTYTVRVILRQIGLGDCQDGTHDAYFYPPANLQPSLTRLTANATVLPGDLLEYNFTLTNIGNLETTYVITGTSDNWTSAASAWPSVVYALGPGNSTAVKLRLTIPSGARPNEMEGSRIFVESSANANFRTLAYTLTTLAPQVFGVRLTPTATIRINAGLGTTVTSNMTVYNDGNYPDTLTMRSTLPPAGWSITFPGFPDVPVGLHSSVNFSVRFVPPTPFAGPLTWTANLTATASDGTTRATTPVNLTVRASDVIVNQASLTVSPAVVALGEEVSATVVVSNAGNGAVENMTLEMRDGTVVRTLLVSLVAPSAAPYTFTWVPTLGSHSITITADPVRIVPELNETNNEGTGVFSVSAPDVAALAAGVHFSDYPNVGTSLTIEFAIRNVGGIQATDISAQAQFGSEIVARWDTPALPAGEEAVLTFTVTVTEPSAFLTLSVDINNTIAELDEANNAVQVTVHGNLPPTPNLALSGYSQVGKRTVLWGNGSVDADGTVAQFYVEFGDGSNSGWVTSPTIRHNYSVEGPKVVTLRVRDDRGSESGLFILNITVLAADAKSPDEKPPASPGMESAAAVLALFAVSIFVVRRRRLR